MENTNKKFPGQGKTPQQYEELKKGFNEVDTDGNGQIDKEELSQLFEKMVIYKSIKKNPIIYLF